MENVKTRPMTFRTSEEIRADFKATYEASGATSQNEFLGMLIKKWMNPEATLQPVTEAEQRLTEEETQEIFKTSFETSDSKSPEEFFDQLLLNFNELKSIDEPETIVTDKPVCEKLKENEIALYLTPAQNFALREAVLSKDFVLNQNKALDVEIKGDFWSGTIFLQPEFKPLFVRNIVLTDEMNETEKENSIRHNVVAFIVNLFFMRLLYEGYDSISVTPKVLKSFVNEHPESLMPELSIRINESGDTVISFSQAQYHAISENVLTPGFIENQNEIIDSLIPDNKPFLYFGSLFEPEFQSLWIRSIDLMEEMTQEQRDNIIRHNMSAFLINMSLHHLIDRKISDSSLTAKTLKTFIQAQNQEIEKETEINS